MADEHTSGSGASQFTPKQCSAFRQGDYILIKTHPCKIVNLSTSKTGKHGHAKVHITALDIFSGKKIEELCPSTHCMNEPIVTRKEYQVLDYDASDNYRLSLLDTTTLQTSDLSIVPDQDSKDKILENEKADCTSNVTVMSYGDTHSLCAVKKAVD